MFKGNNKDHNDVGDFFLVCLLLTLNVFPTFSLCFYCWLWTVNCLLGWFKIWPYKVCNFFCTVCFTLFTADLEQVLILRYECCNGAWQKYLICILYLISFYAHRRAQNTVAENCSWAIKVLSKHFPI